MNRSSVFLLVFLLASLAASPTPALGASRTSLQGGVEYDSNVFKAFGGSVGDPLVRVLFKTQGRGSPAAPFEWGWNLQVGGKKFFHEEAKDVLIQYGELPLTFFGGSAVSIRLVPEFKYQNESNRIQALPASLPPDVNEDFWSPSGSLVLRFALPADFTAETAGNYTLFRYTGYDPFSYHCERGGVSLRHPLPLSLSTTASYAYSRQQFRGGPRADSTQEASAYLQYTALPFASARYTFQSNHSSASAFDNSNHRLTLLVSFPVGRRTETAASDGGEDQGNALFAVHVLTTLQFRRYPSVYDDTSEGRRYLLTGAEDDNFSSVLAKLSFHPIPRMALEAKFTMYFNDFSAEQEGFNRYLAYGGLRYGF